MSKNYALKAVKKDRAGKGAARSLRRENKVPAVIYGDHKEPVMIALDGNIINVEYRKGHMFTSVCDMDMEGQNQQVLARDIQLHPVTDLVEHIDFLRVTPKTRIAVFVPVHFINEEKSPGLKNKAILNVVRYEVELYCFAADIPDFVEADLDGKDFGDAVRISDVKLPEGVKPVIDNRNFTIAMLVEPKKIEEVDEAAPAAEGAAEGAEGQAAPAAEGGDQTKPEAKKEGK